MRAEKTVRIPIVYHSNQVKILSSQKKKKVIAKGRRFGLTKCFVNRAIEYMLKGISPLLWVDTVNSNIDRYIERYFYPVLKYLPKQIWQWRQQRKELTILNSKLDIRSADRPELIEGFSYRVIFLNEAGIILKNRYLWENAIQPMMLDYNPEIFIGGTPKGKGLFYELALRAQTDTKNWEFFRFTSFDNPFLKREELEELINEIPKSIQRQEIYAEFLDNSFSLFKNLEDLAVSIKEEPRLRKNYYAGLDLAKLHDYTVLIILDEEGKQVYMDRFNIISWEAQKKKIYEAVKKYNNALLLMDSTGVGDPIFEDLKNTGLRVEGYKFTAETKKRLIEALMLSFDKGMIKIINDPVLISELSAFEYEISPSGYIHYQAPEGMHDDCVIALALANWALINKPEFRIWSI